jgi:hypothetical protein
VGIGQAFEGHFTLSFSLFARVLADLGGQKQFLREGAIFLTLSAPSL